MVNERRAGIDSSNVFGGHGGNVIDPGHPGEAWV
jgi:hypothetical protein